MLNSNDWNVEYISEAQKDFDSLDGSQRLIVANALKKIVKNPLPDYKGGYGKPLSNKRNLDLSSLLKVKLKSSGIRIVYKIVEINHVMTIIVIGARADNEVYILAKKRVMKYNMK